MNKINLQLVRELKELSNKVNFVILKDYFIENDYNDIDILTSSSNRLKLFRFLKSQGYRTNANYRTSIFFHKIISGELVRLHIHFNLFYYYISSDFANKHSQKKYGINFLNETQYLSTLIYKIQDNRNENKYQLRIKKEINQKKIDEKLLRVSLGKVYFEKSMNIKKLKIGKGINDLIVKKEHKKRILFRTLSDYPSIFFLAIKQFFSPSPYIVIMGVDGSGKTTTVKNLEETLSQKKFRIFSFYGGRFKFQFLPINRFVRSVAKNEIKKGQNKNIIHYKSKKVFYLTPMIYYIEYLLRYTFKIFIKRRTHNFVISDRSYVDVIISPNSNSTFAKFLYKILPKPSHLFYIYNDSKVIINRRSDHPKEDLLRQLKEFEKIGNFFDAKIKTKNQKQTLEEIMCKLFP